ncbi:MAG: chromosome segregation protein SMC [Candidatus Eisenbacteria bacterium]
MYVSRIEMTGFKSFADRTIVDLEPGLAAVVGPNGCGKTNICDAIRWVLGEENVRMLRGSRIEDIIFSGTELRKSTGMAEVALTLSDVQDALPVEYNEVTVARRVFRSGESQFYINKVPSRLKDIVDLFLGTGMGRRAYSVMERDMIDSILDDNSGQRRKIIEEAAGVSRYKVRRKETMNKLELTQRDLERVEDLISEVERRVKQLSRQAAKARRYDRLAGRIKEVETYGSVKDFDVMKKRRREIDKELESVETNLAAAARDISVAEAEIEKMKLEILEIDKEINSHGQEMSGITDRIQKSESEKIVLSERRRAIDEKLAEISESMEEKKESIKEKSELIKAKRQELRADSDRLDALTSTNHEVNEEYRAAESELRARREQSVVSAKETIASMKRHIDVASAVTEVRSKRNHLGELLDRTQVKHDEMSERITGVEHDVAGIASHLEDLNGAFAGKETEIAQLTGVIDELRDKIEQIRDKRSRLGEQAATASSRHDVFKEIVERYEGYETGVKALMQSGKSDQRVHGVLGDIVKCTEPRYEPAVVAALSDAVQYVVVEGKADAADSVKMLKDEKKGSATLVMLDSISGAGGRDSSSIPETRVIGRITDFIECESRYRELLDYLLCDVFIVETLEDAFDLSDGEGDHTCSFVTPDGDAVFRGSIVRSGGNGGASAVLIGRKEKVADLASEAKALRSLAEEQAKAFREVTASLDDLVGRRESTLKEHAEARSVINDQERLLHASISERDSLKRALADLASEIAGMKVSIEAVEKQIAETGCVPQSPEVGQGGLFEDGADNAELEARAEKLQKQLEDNGREILRLQSNLGFTEETIERVTAEIEALTAGLAHLKTGTENLDTKKDDLSREEEAVDRQVEELLAVLAEVDTRRKTTLEKKRGIEATIEDVRARIKSSQGERESLLSGKQEFHAESNLLEVKSHALKKRMLEEYDLDISRVALKDLTECENCEEEIVKLRGHLRNLGPVNLVALDEYDVEKERYDFLKSQRDDLIKARESLDQAILQINRRARSEFAETFHKVRDDFRKNFHTLFQGGDADLRLRYENDPLESPVDILARPSGKKLEQISLLSGGERALTAIAFMFAVYYTKPSPFCLLDEVDAPLDDANVLRFMNLIKDFSVRTQFLMVTHNKKTMEAASCLYGVTMEEPGVSRMVSVKLEPATEEVLEPVG